MQFLKRKANLLLLIILLIGATACGSREPQEQESRDSQNILDTAREAVGDAGQSVGSAIGQAAEGARAVIDSASDTAGTTASQVGDAVQAAATVVVDQGGAAVETAAAVGGTASSAVRERFASLKPDENGKFSVTIYESEVNQIIKLQELFTGPIPGNPLRNTEVSFDNGEILFTADVFEPLVGRLIIRFTASVEDGSPHFSVIQASLGDSEAPDNILEAARNLLDITLGATFNYLPDGVKPREIVIANGQFTISGGPDSSE